MSNFSIIDSMIIDYLYVKCFAILCHSAKNTIVYRHRRELRDFMERLANFEGYFSINFFNRLKIFRLYNRRDI